MNQFICFVKEWQFLNYYMLIKQKIIILKYIFLLN